jgi:hypothetical protein
MSKYHTYKGKAKLHNIQDHKKIPTVQEALTGREYTSEMRQGVIHDPKRIIVKTRGDVACRSMVV